MSLLFFTLLNLRRLATLIFDTSDRRETNMHFVAKMPRSIRSTVQAKPRICRDGRLAQTLRIVKAPERWVCFKHVPDKWTDETGLYFYISKQRNTMAKLIISERRIGDVTILDLDGYVTIGDNSGKFRMVIRRLLGDEQRNLILNMADVRKVDSSGLGEIVSGYRATDREGGSLKLLNLTHNFIDLISITKLLTVFESFENEQEAIASFR